MGNICLRGEGTEGNLKTFDEKQNKITWDVVTGMDLIAVIPLYRLSPVWPPSAVDRVVVILVSLNTHKHVATSYTLVDTN